MANITGLKGLSTPTVSKLIASYGDDMVDAFTGKGFGLALTPGNNVEMETFLGSLMFQNGVDRPLSYDGTFWTTTNLALPPIGKYMRVWRSRQRVYVAYCTLSFGPVWGKTVFPSRVFYCDLPKSNTIQWGIMYGGNLNTTANDSRVFMPNAGFQTYGIKRGDPLFITNGGDLGTYADNDIGQYTIISVDSDQQVHLDKPLTKSFGGLAFWAGGNWFDVGPDDSDFITWMEINNDTLLIFKRDTLYRVTNSDGSSITQIRGAYGTTSGRSVKSIHEVTVYWYSGIGLSTGFYAYNGLYSQNISRPLDNHIAGIDPNVNPVAWTEGELYRCFVGNIINFSKGINVPNAVLTWDYVTKTWSVDPISDIPTVATEFRQSKNKSAYFGTTTDSVMVTPQGTTANSIDLDFSANVGTLYPQGSMTICEYLRIQIISRNMEGVQVQYRLHLKPFASDPEFRDLGEINNERTEIYFKKLPEWNKASGIEIRFQATDGRPAEGSIDKFTLFYRPSTTVIR